jgi:Flp pilus assembly protein TadG
MLYLPKSKIKPLSTLREQKGQSIIIFTFAVLGLIAMLGLALDLGLVYIERVRVNRTTDAATLASVVELPYEQDAIERAIEYIRLNGYDANPVDGDTEILVRGCVDLDRSTPFSVTNVSEANLDPITPTNKITGALYIAAAEQPPRATFVIDTGSHQVNDTNGENCNSTADLYGTATKIQVTGLSNVEMNFMQFFGFGTVPVQDEAIAENITNLDVVIVFDVSGSMEYETNCYDCWVRETYDVISRPYPENGYYNPLPYNPAWAGAGVAQSIPLSNLCTVFPPSPYVDDNGTAGNPNDDLYYLVHEAELYSYNDWRRWRFSERQPGNGFWVIQRGSRDYDNVVDEISGDTKNEKDYQGNQAGNIGTQSSNVCNPPAGGIDCNVDPGGGSICNSVDCSAYIKAHPYPTYSQGSLSQAGLQGAAYDSNCFSAGSLSGNCWNNPAAPQSAPYVEYDFTPTWSGNTYIWLRARGGSDRAEEWRGNPPTSLTAWENAVYWQVDGGPVTENTDVARANNSWRDNRATNGEWQWIRLGSVNTGSANSSHTLRIYQGSAGYKIDKIVFTDDSGGSDFNPPAAMLLDSNGASDIGPRASNGSATREACNPCNPAYGYEVDSTDCTCKLNANDGGLGSGSGCSSVLTTTRRLEDDLYSGVQPIRGAQEAVKRFVLRLQPQFDQVGFVAFTGSVINNDGVDEVSRSKLQCLKWAQNHHSQGGQGCYDNSVGTPISYTHVLKAIERHWPRGGTSIAEGMREGLVELGVSGYAADSNCTDTVGNPAGTDDDGHACDRGGAARRVLILLTDGMPNGNPGSCNPNDTGQDLWDGLIGPDDDNFECAMYYAWQAAENNVTVYAIGLGAGVNGDLLTAMATGVDPRGGVLNDGNDVTYFNGRGGTYENAATPEDLDQIFSNILSNIYIRIVG